MEILLIFWRIAWRYPRKFIFTLVLQAFQSIVEMGAVLSLAPIIDLITKPDLQGITPLTMGLLGFLKSIHLPANIYGIMGVVFLFLVIKVIISLLVFYSIQDIKYALNKDMDCSTFDVFFNAGWMFFSKNNLGVLGNTFIKEIGKIIDSFSQMLIFLTSFSRLIIYLLIALFVSWKFSVIIILLSLVMILLLSLFGKITYRLGKIDTVTANRIYEVINENLSAAKVVIGYGEQRKASHYLSSALDAHIDVVKKSMMISNGIPMVFQTMGMGLIILLILLSLTWIKIPISELAIVVYSFYSALPIIGQVVAARNQMLNLHPAYEQLNRLRMLAEKDKQLSGELTYNNFKESLDFKGVSFSYSKGIPVLSDVNCTVPKGKMIAMVGRSGAGKSTLVDLILRLFDPSEGQILVDGVDLKEFTLFSWRQKVGYVPQDSILFNMTIRQNLKWSKEDANEEALLTACKMANADEFIVSLPDKLDTMVGDRGVRLSGGQRQRIALARAILRNPDLLILDEATSSLDSHSERLIQNAIENISHKTTIVVVAHRLSTIISADMIYFFEKGKIVEQGVFHKLCSDKGAFYELAKVQGLV